MNSYQGGNIKESDWKLFSKRIADWQENYMNRLNKEYIRILTQDKAPSDIFWELDGRIKNDKKKTGVVIHGKSRSHMLCDIAELINETAINMDDLSDFSEDLREAVRMICRL